MNFSEANGSYAEQLKTKLDKWRSVFSIPEKNRIAIATEKCQEDPYVVEFMKTVLRTRKEDGSGGEISRPVEIVGEKRALRIQLVAGLYRVEHPNISEAEREEICFSALAALTHSQTIFLTEPMQKLLHEMSKKLLPVFAENPNISRRSLPFPILYISSNKGEGITNVSGEVHHADCIIINAADAGVPVMYQINQGERSIRVSRQHPAMIEALCLLLEEKLTEIVKLRPPRAFRRATSTNNTASEVNVIVLRRKEYESQVDCAPDGNRRYSCQWVVSGHFRQQWYPSEQVHRVKWIDPHIKGPEDAPFKETVRILQQ